MNAKRFFIIYTIYKYRTSYHNRTENIEVETDTSEGTGTNTSTGTGTGTSTGTGAGTSEEKRIFG